MAEFLAETYAQLLGEQLPNLFRLYLNPYVVQTCFCLERYIQESWQAGAAAPESYQSFLANSFDEALSGAIKLGRYCASIAGRPTAGLVIDPAARLGPFASSEHVEFLPGLAIHKTLAGIPEAREIGFVVLASGDILDLHAESVRRFTRAGALTIVCVDRQTLMGTRGGIKALPVPDIVVFDESFVRREVPFAAFSARRPLYDYWNKSGRATFHSTTFQPNTVSTLHFLRCLERDDPSLHERVSGVLQSIAREPRECLRLLRRLYSPSLARAIDATGFAVDTCRAQGAFVTVRGRSIFDAVGGVACSVRGHNPPAYAKEIEALVEVDCEAEVTARLRELTGLPHVLPAVSGAGAVENALKIALVAQFPRRHVVALRLGFGGKTLVALTGTWNASYKEHIEPLYSSVVYVDPFAADAAAQLDAVFEAHPVAVVQMELIQGVGGVRCISEPVIKHIAAQRARYGYLLLVDEVQTGVHRTGPFTRARALNLTPDLLVVGKAVSDMMFPFALTLYADAVQARLAEVGSRLSDTLRRRYAYPWGFKTALNVLRFAQATGLAEHVAAAGALFARLLDAELAGCKAVRAVRTYGLLIGIELDATSWPQRWFRKRLFWFYLAALLRHPRFPVLVGYCQYEPNVLKITPPLTITPDHIQHICTVIGEVLRRPFYRLLTGAVGNLVRSYSTRRKRHAFPDQPTHEPVPR